MPAWNCDHRWMPWPDRPGFIYCPNCPAYRQIDKGNTMKVKIVIQTWETLPTDNPLKTKFQRRQSEIWSGELEILKDNEYLAKISIIAEGEPQPICDIPFAIGIGHYMWIPANIEVAEEDEGWNLAHLEGENDEPDLN